MFTLKLYDRKGQELNEGDIVKISDGTRFTFYAEVKYLEKENAIAPFHTFSFHSFEKIDALPKNVIQSTEERYKIWIPKNPQQDTNAADYKKYLIDWRTCEHNIDNRYFKIERRK